MTYEQWLAQSGWVSRHIDSTVERFDGIDLSAHLQAEYRRYLSELDMSDPATLEQYDLSGELTVEPGDDGDAVIRLPEPYRRLVAVQLRGWNRPAAIIDGNAADSGKLSGMVAEVLGGLGNPYAGPTVRHPVAVRFGRVYILYPATDNTLALAVGV